jgi:hypothetical protein
MQQQSTLQQRSVLFILALVLALGVALFAPVTAQATDQYDACWGQASAGYAKTGEMGEHSSSYDTPRLGLRNLARLLYEAGMIEDDSMQALGAFVATSLDETIEACEQPE